MTTEQQTRTSLVLPAGYVFVRGKRQAKAHISGEHATTLTLCRHIVRSDGWNKQMEAGKVCKVCVKAAQKKGLGLRYE